MKSALFAIALFALNPTHIYAHGNEDSAAEQVQELLPFAHFTEGHFWAFGMSILLWYALIITLYLGVRYASKRFTRSRARYV